MDIATIVGVIAGFALVVMSILAAKGNMGDYLSLSSIIMVLGGSLSALIVANPLSRVLGITKYFSIALRTINFQEEQIISQLVGFSEKARREGLLALEDDLEDVGEEFMRKGIQLVVDGSDPEIIKSILYNDVNQLEARHSIGINIFDLWGKLAPAFGMIGTLAGLVAMLAVMEDKSAIGSGMALALITTLYGAIFANLVFIPIKRKLQDKSTAEVLVREIMIEGILSIQSGDNPRILEEKLVSFLPPTRREAVRQEAAAD